MDKERKNDKMQRKKADRWTRREKERFSCERDAEGQSVELCVF